MTNLPATTATGMAPFDEIQRMGAAIARSGLFGIKTPDQAVALMLIAQAEGRHPAIVARDYDIIQGRPAKKAEAVQRDFIAAGGTIEWHALSDEIADASFSHPAGGKVRITWTLEQAKAAGLASKDNWRKFPRAMLRARCVSEGCRTVCPSSTSGLYVPEEVQDFEAKSPREVSELPPPANAAEAFTGHRSAREEVAHSGAMSDLPVDEALPTDEERAAIDAGFESLKEAKALRQAVFKKALSNTWDEASLRATVKEQYGGRGLRGLTKDELMLVAEMVKRKPPKARVVAPEFAPVTDPVPEVPNR